jgi:hypothetical protein
MRHLKLKYFSLLFPLLGVISANAQDWSPLYHADSLQSLHVIMDVAVFEKMGDQSPFFEGMAEVKRTGTLYFSSFSGMEMLMSTEYLILTNLHDRSISVSRRDKQGEQALAKDILSSLDSMLRSMRKPQKMETKDGTIHYQYIPTGGEITVVDIYMSNDRNLQQITYRYRSGQFARTLFKKFDTKAEFGPLEISEVRYFSSLIDTVKLQEPYTRFRVIWN